MLFSVVICTYNRALTLRRGLVAVEALLPPRGGSWELIVVDNASTDDTRAVVEGLAARAAFPVRYLHEPRLGHSVALNAGVRASRGEVIAFTDDDALPVPDWLRQIEAALAAYEADWVFGKVVPEWNGAPPRWFSPRFDPHFALLDYGPEPFVVTTVKQPFFGVNHACRSSALARIGTYREDLGLVGDLSGEGNEIDLFQRALATGLRVAYQPAALVRHMIAPDRRTKRYWRRRNLAMSGPLYQQLLADPPAVPWLLGLPRYFFRFALGDLGSYLKGLLTLDGSKAFYHEIYVLRFLGMLYQAGRRGFRKGVLARPAQRLTA
jgi:glycosyltransferase involved in cell wall biosynthesis